MGNITISDKIDAINAIDKARKKNEILDEHIFTDQLRAKMLTELEDYYKNMDQTVKKENFDNYFASYLKERFNFSPYKLSTFQKLLISIYRFITGSF